MTSSCSIASATSTNVLRGRPDHRPDPQRRPDQAQWHADVRRPAPLGRRLHRQARQGGQARRHRRADHRATPRPDRRARDHPDHQRRHGQRHQPARPEQAQLPRRASTTPRSASASPASTTPPASSGSPSSTAAAALEDELARVAPSELLIHRRTAEDASAASAAAPSPTTATPSSTSRPTFTLKRTLQGPVARRIRLQRHARRRSAPPARILHYLKSQLRRSVDHITRLQVCQPDASS